MADAEQLKSLVDQMPDPDGRGMYTENVNKENLEKRVAAMAEGGKEYLLGLISMLGEPGTTEDSKPHFALHCVVNYALVTGNEDLRRDFCDAMASQLENDELTPYNRAYLCQELQWAGRDEACEALGRVLNEEELTDAAATALVAIGGERAAAQLRTAADRAKGKCLLNVIDALALLDDSESAVTFLKLLNDEDREVRLAAGLGLARLGGAAAINPLLQAADCEPGWERIQQTKHCLVLAEKLAASGNKAGAKRVYERLEETRRGDSEQHVRDAARRGLAAVA